MRPIIYTPSGRAGEYANKGYAVNLFRGCTHGCTYCYVPAMLRMSKEEFHSKVVPVKDGLKRLECDLEKLGKIDEPIFMSFTCDPYCKDADIGITAQAITWINYRHSNNAVSILTKGRIPIKHIQYLTNNPNNKIGVTLTSMSDSFSLKIEPGASLPAERLGTLRYAHDAGIQTWASIEPVIDPMQSLKAIQYTMPYVDEFKIGKWNHNKEADKIDWIDFMVKADELLNRNHKKYIFKKDLMDIWKKFKFGKGE